MTFEQALAEVWIEDHCRAREVQPEILEFALRVHRANPEMLDDSVQRGVDLARYAAILVGAMKECRLEVTVGLTRQHGLRLGPLGHEVN